MFPKILKIFLASLSLGYAIYLFIDDYIGNGIMMTIVSGVVNTFVFQKRNHFFSFSKIEKTRLYWY